MNLQQQVDTGCTWEIQDDSKLVLELDEEIRDVVMILRRHGFHTFTSCSGKADHGFAYPMVRMTDTNVEALTNVLVNNGYTGFYIKKYYYTDNSFAFLEIEFWSLDCLKVIKKD